MCLTAKFSTPWQQGEVEGMLEIGSGGSRKKIFGDLTPHHLGGNNG